jgi:Right handed beta helix region
VTLSGAGQGSTTIAGQGAADQSDLMTIAGGVRAVLENVTVTGAGRTAIANHGTLEARDSELSGNGTQSGDCCDVGGILNDGDLTLERTKLDGNVGVGAGAVLSDGIARILDSTITDNAALFEAGGIFSRGEGRLVLRNSTVTGNVSQGAAVLGGGASTVIEGTTVSGNGGDLAGGIYGGNLVVRDSLIEGNHGFNGGAGGIAATFGDTHVVRSTIRDNSISTSTRGGGIRNDAGSSMMLVNTVVTGNSVPEGQGGGIWNGGRLRVVASAIIGNAVGSPQDPGVGGGIYNVGTIFLAATLVADNFPDDCFGCPTG